MNMNKTVLFDGKKEIELKDWDKYINWTQRVKAYFEEVKEYAGFPDLPDFWDEGYLIYSRASKREKDMIASHSMSLYMGCLQHWRSMMDDLYDPAKRPAVLKTIHDHEAIFEKAGITPKAYKPFFYLG